MMTRKDYKFFAECMSDLIYDRAEFHHILERMKIYFKKDNPNFREDLFAQAIR